MKSCTCLCHVRHDALSYKYGVDVRDPVACVLACEGCRGNHAAVLDEPPSRPPMGDTSTAWVDSQPDGDKGEGSE